MISADSTFREKAETSARAKIFWGDAREAVIKDLMNNGMTPEEANELVKSFVHERTNTVRRMGSRKIFIGLGLVALTLAPWIVICIMMHKFFMPPVTVLCVPGSIFVYGAYSLLSGSMLYLLPDNLTGDIAEAD